MKYYYRCMKCRTRNVFLKPLDEYVRPRLCRSCQWWRFYEDKEMMRRAMGARNDYCTCGSVHYTHRFKSKVCSNHPDYQYTTRVEKYGEDPREVLMDMAWDQAPVDEEVPF